MQKATWPVLFMFTAAIENLPPPNRIFTRDPGCFMASHQDVLSAEANSILFSSTYTSPTPSVICCWIAGTGSQRLVSRPPLTSCIYKLLSEIVRTKQSADNVSGVVSGSLSGKTCRGVEVIVSWSHGGASSTEVLIDVPFRKDVSGEESAMTRVNPRQNDKSRARSCRRFNSNLDSVLRKRIKSYLPSPRFVALSVFELLSLKNRFFSFCRAAKNWATFFVSGDNLPQ